MYRVLNVFDEDVGIHSQKYCIILLWSLINFFIHLVSPSECDV